MFRNVLLKSDGSVVNIQPAVVNKTFSLQEMQLFVGGYIEMYPTNDGKSYVIMNEEGSLQNLPFNRLASDFCNFYTLFQGRGTKFKGDIVIVDQILFS